MERFEFDLLRTFQSEWFEVAIWPPRTGEEEFPEFLAPDKAIESFPAGSPSRKRNRATSARRSSGRLHSESGLYFEMLSFLSQCCKKPGHDVAHTLKNSVIYIRI